MFKWYVECTVMILFCCSFLHTEVVDVFSFFFQYFFGFDWIFGKEDLEIQLGAIKLTFLVKN